jgi:predicted DCC family thiol-disulfide oxidoreductase YuxK
MTEITEQTDQELVVAAVSDRQNREPALAPGCAPCGMIFRGWILYDGDCGSCIGLARRFTKTFRPRGFEFLPLQTAWVQQRLGLAKNARPEEMRLLTLDGRNFAGSAAAIFLARQIWWTWPLYALAQIPAMTRVIERGYRWVVAHRGCGLQPGPTCAAKPKHVGGHRPPLQNWSRFASLLPLIAVLFGRKLVAPWIFMWLMAAAFFFAAKLLTFFRAQQSGGDLFRTFSYFFLWPGMDARSFFEQNQTAIAMSVCRFDQTRISKILVAFGRICLGVALLFGVARMVSPDLLQGWIAMIGLVLILHFGIFDLIAIAWRNAGINVRPIMNAPVKSTALTEFWGRRWNGAFNQLVLDLFFRRLARFFGATLAMLGSFLFSGLLHELVISLPAAGGYGLPTGYFLLQGAGSIAQRKLGMRGGVCGWMSTMAIVAAPAFWLFHPLFVRRVILPFMQAIGAV